MIDLVGDEADTGPFGGSEWVGMENYARLFQDPELIGALRNTALYTVIALIGIPLAVGIAALLNTSGLKGRSAYRTLYFIPVGIAFDSSARRSRTPAAVATALAPGAICTPAAVATWPFSRVLKP